MTFLGGSALYASYTTVLLAGGLHFPVERDQDGHTNYISLFGVKERNIAELVAEISAVIKGCFYSPVLFTPIQESCMSIYPVEDKWCPVIVLSYEIHVLISMKAEEEAAESKPISNNLKVAKAISCFLAEELKLPFDPSIGMLLHYSIQTQHIPGQQFTSELWHELRFQPQGPFPAPQNQ